MNEGGSDRIGFDVLPLPFMLRVPSDLVARLGLKGPLLTPESIVRAATRKAGLPERLPGHVGKALEVLCRSLADDAKPHWFGRMNPSTTVASMWP